MDKPRGVCGTSVGHGQRGWLGFCLIFDYDYEDEDYDESRIAPATRPETLVALVKPSLMRHWLGPGAALFRVALIVQAGRKGWFL